MKRDEDLESIVQQAFLDAFPNPNRVGCPGKRALQTLLERREQGDPDIWAHISQCSPCSRELLELRKAEERKWARLAVWAVAACLLLAAAFFLMRPGRGDKQSLPVIPNSEAIAQLDFRHVSAERGGESTLAPVPNVRKSAVALAILLPDRSESGIYQLDLRAAANIDKPVLGPLTGEAITTPDGTTRLTVHVNLAVLPVGSYIAAWRRSSGSPMHFGTFFLSP
jgi:hypothetical protein